MMMLPATLLLLLILGHPPDDLVAVGVVVSPDALRSSAILRSGGKSHVATVGEKAFGGRLTAVSARSVTVEFEGRSTEIPVKSAGTPQVFAPPNPMDAGAARTLSRADLDKRLGSEIPRIMAETVLTPVNAGSVKGVALSRIPQGSLLTDAGLQQGDVLTEVDGVPIDSPMTLLSLYPKLQTESQVQAVVLRNGQPVTLTLSLR
jgi:type II secretion system protein C